MGIYQIRAEDINNKIVDFEDYRGKVLLVVNTATKCFFTPQYEGLQKLQEKFSDKGFFVLDFPCNQFGNDAPGTTDEINEYCVKRFETTFPRFQKVEVNGSDEFILFTYLKRHQKGIFGKKIKWNFTKFLVDQNGKVVKRYSPHTNPSKIRKDIEKLFK